MADDFMTGFLAGQGDDKNSGGWGGDGSWIVLIILFALFGGNGFGGFGGNRDGGGALTRADLCDGFNFQNVERGIQGIQSGLCDGFYAQNTTMLQGFNGIGNAISGLGYQMQNCCCETNRNVDNLRYDMSKGFCDVIQAGHNDTDRVIAYLTADKIESLRTELQSAQLQLSNAAQTQNIVDQLRPCPTPAYLTCNPWASQAPYGGCGSCGC